MARTVQLYGYAAASSNNAANVEITRASRLKGIQLAFNCDLDADSEVALVEVSLVPYAQEATNDALNVLTTVELRQSGTLGDNAINHFYPVDCPIPAGSRVYLNFVLVGTADATARAILHLD